MRPSKQQNKEAPARNGDPGDLWHAMARLHATHPDPVGLGWPFERPAARLSIVKPEDIVLSARVELFEGEPVRSLRDVLGTVAHDLDKGSGFGEYALVPDVALELMIAVREELPLHTGHVAGLTQLLRDSIGTIGARSTPGGGQCFHCEGTGKARPLWERSLSTGYDVA
ncbi:MULTISPECIES: hypothetical protein [Streptomyces]|uniref:Uncharacterized protein n=1 Tax=Streptomyces dengpaensis TaxID=2049881 RepID=A0ABM6T3U3_9ACTN|nr:MULTISPECIES: hypothetical protein [Streptomyces]AVH61815.1 hypothetical protein C4B68_40590 [Streptomyces dengpaensis]PIB04563.1 hypothetical protein B1C81_32880 [Streptomyces sp. HG99]